MICWSGSFTIFNFILKFIQFLNTLWKYVRLLIFNFCLNFYTLVTFCDLKIYFYIIYYEKQSSNRYFSAIRGHSKYRFNIAKWCQRDKVFKKSCPRSLEVKSSMTHSRFIPHEWLQSKLMLKLFGRNQNHSYLYW